MKHLIKKQELLLRIVPGIEPFGIQHAASQYYRDRLLPILEKVFDELSNEEEVVAINRLVIDIGRIAEKSLRAGAPEDALYALIKKELLRVLKGGGRHAGFSRAALRESVLAQWWYYMEKGRLPWNVAEINKDWYQRVLEVLSVDYGSVTRLRQALGGNPVFLQRVSYQHPPAFLEKLAGILTGVRQSLLGQRVEDVCFLSRWLEKTFYSLMGVIGVQAGSAEERAVVIRALRRWTEVHAAFLSLSDVGRKAAIWQLVLREAALHPEATRGSGAERVLYRHYLYPGNVVIRKLQRESGLDLPALWFGEEGKPSGQEEQPQPAAGMYEQKEFTAGSSVAGEHIATGKVEVVGDAVVEAGGVDSGVGSGVHPVVQESGEDGIYARLAGLVLLHPFLGTFFSRCGLWEKEAAFVSAEARQQAVFLLYFLATGEKEAPEYELLFPKLLCGYDLEATLPGRAAIPDSAYVEAESLLQNVLLQWDKLKNTSIAGLREGFLQRTGKLMRHNDRLSVQLEISGIDVLLDFLPWGLSVVKLPWIKELLFVEWR